MKTFSYRLIMYYFLFLGIGLFGLGIVLLRRKKIMISRMLIGIILFSNVIIIMMNSFIGEPFRAEVFVVYIMLIFGFIFLLIITTTGKYVIYSVNLQVFKDQMEKYFTEKGIEYLEDNGVFILNGYERKEIRVYSNSSNILEIDLSEIRKDKFYHEIKEGLRESLNNIKMKYFSLVSIILIIGGIALIAMGIFWLRR